MSSGSSSGNTSKSDNQSSGSQGNVDPLASGARPEEDIAATATNEQKARQEQLTVGDRMRSDRPEHDTALNAALRQQ